MPIGHTTTSEQDNQIVKVSVSHSNVNKGYGTNLSISNIRNYAEIDYVSLSHDFSHIEPYPPISTF